LKKGLKAKTLGQRFTPKFVGESMRAQLEAALVPPGMAFVAENHVNVIYPPSRTPLEELEEIVRQLNSQETQELVSLITGNTQISKNELEKLFPIRLSHGLAPATRRV